MKESQLCTEIIKSVNIVPNSYAWKIPDVSGKDRATQQFAPARGFDLLIVHRGYSVAVEVKLIKAPTTVPPRRFTEFEMRSLDAIEKAGGRAWVMVGFVFAPTDVQIQKYDLPKRVRELYVTPFHHLEYLWEVGEYSYPWIREDARCVKVEFQKGAWNFNFPGMFINLTTSIKQWDEPFIIRRK